MTVDQRYVQNDCLSSERHCQAAVGLTDNNNNSARLNNIASGGRSKEKVTLMLETEVGCV
jgi:hypothetical protein